MKKLLSFVLITLSMACQMKEKKSTGDPKEVPQEINITLNEANRLAALPLHCIQTEFPNKLNQTLASKEEINTPQSLHPAFYGCYDWHSSVHGHWMLIKLLKTFPDLDHREEIIQKLKQNISSTNILKEVEYFKRGTEKSFERTYGWAWLLKLAEELHTWDSPDARILEESLQPLSNYIVNKYIDFLPRLHYAIRVGEHTNTAFGLSFAWDYANTVQHIELKTLIETRAREFYLADTHCPINWEPSGFDFLSPCLQEMDIMRRVLPADEFQAWLDNFMPQLADDTFLLEPGIVSDRQDGKLVHLDGVNFSRAWCLYALAKQYKQYQHLSLVANEHIHHSLPNITDGNYEGTHWLASFALYALDAGSKQ